MLHEDTLIATLAVSLAFAFLFGLAAVRLRMPPLVGYMVAGIALSPYTPASSPIPTSPRSWPRSASCSSCSESARISRCAT